LSIKPRAVRSVGERKKKGDPPPERKKEIACLNAGGKRGPWKEEDLPAKRKRTATTARLEERAKINVRREGKERGASFPQTDRSTNREKGAPEGRGKGKEKRGKDTFPNTRKAFFLGSGCGA